MNTGLHIETVIWLLQLLQSEGERAESENEGIQKELVLGYDEDKVYEALAYAYDFIWYTHKGVSGAVSYAVSDAVSGFFDDDDLVCEFVYNEDMLKLLVNVTKTVQQHLSVQQHLLSVQQHLLYENYDENSEDFFGYELVYAAPHLKALADYITYVPFLIDG